MIQNGEDNGMIAVFKGFELTTILNVILQNIGGDCGSMGLVPWQERRSRGVPLDSSTQMIRGPIEQESGGPLV